MSLFLSPPHGLDPNLLVVMWTCSCSLRSLSLCMCIQIYMCMCIYIYRFIYKCIHVYIYICIYIYSGLVTKSYSCKPMDCSQQGSSVPRIFQARLLKWVASPSPGDLLGSGIKPWSPALQADSLQTELPGKHMHMCVYRHTHTHTHTHKKVEVLVTQLSPTLLPHGVQPTKLLCSWDSPGRNTGVGCYSLLWGIFLTQGSNPGSPALQADFFLPSEPLLI